MITTRDFIVNIRPFNLIFVDQSFTADEIVKSPSLVLRSQIESYIPIRILCLARVQVSERVDEALTQKVAKRFPFL